MTVDIADVEEGDVITLQRGEDRLVDRTVAMMGGSKAINVITDYVTLRAFRAANWEIVDHKPARRLPEVPGVYSDGTPTDPAIFLLLEDGTWRSTTPGVAQAMATHMHRRKGLVKLVPASEVIDYFNKQLSGWGFVEDIIGNARKHFGV